MTFVRHVSIDDTVWKVKQHEPISGSNVAGPNYVSCVDSLVEDIVIEESINGEYIFAKDACSVELRERALHAAYQVAFWVTTPCARSGCFERRTEEGLCALLEFLGKDSSIYSRHKCLLLHCKLWQFEVLSVLIRRAYSCF